MSLEPAQRPDYLQREVDRAFKTIEWNTGSDWGLFNGAPHYYIANIKEYNLVGQLIRSRPTQKVFNVIDIGAGNFQWGADLAYWIHQNITEHLPELTVNIINVRGEKHKPQEYKLGFCKVHNIGSFKIEEIGLEFKRLDFDLENNVDFIISRWTFIHLVDPLKTLFDTMNLLKPRLGYALIGGFYFEIEGHKYHRLQLPRVLVEANLSFLRLFNATDRDLDHFILRRNHDSPLQLSMDYARCSEADPKSVIGSKYFTCFSSPLLLPEIRIATHQKDLGSLKRTLDYYVQGDGELFLWLKINHLFRRKMPNREPQGWLPIEIIQQGTSRGLTLSGKSPEQERSDILRAVWKKELDAISIEKRNCLYFHIGNLSGKPMELKPIAQILEEIDLSIFEEAVILADLGSKFTPLF